jgi:hypothetical protein
MYHNSIVSTLILGSFLVEVVHAQYAPASVQGHPQPVQAEPSPIEAHDGRGQKYQRPPAATVTAAQVTNSPPFTLQQDQAGEFDNPIEQLPHEVVETALPALTVEPLFYQGALLEPLQVPMALSRDGIPVPVGPIVYQSPDGLLYKSSGDLLPPAGDPNDFQSSPLFRSQSLGVGINPAFPAFFFGPAAEPDAATPFIRYGVQARPGIFYDTGYVNGAATFNPANIAVDGSDGAHSRGQLFFNMTDGLASLPVRGQLDLQNAQFFSFGPAQAYVDAVFIDGDAVFARSAYFRLFADLENAIAVGKAETVFGDVEDAPSLISTGALPVGAVAVQQTTGETAFTGIPQVRYSRYWGDARLETTISMEDQSEFDDVIDAGTDTTLLHRWPVIVGRTRFTGLNEFDSYQVAALVRPIGFDDSGFNDHFTTGWGISAIARFCNRARTDALYIGGVGGDGVGGYIFGGTKSALITDTEINTLSNIGAYVAYQHVWAYQTATRNLTSNILYGYVSGDAARPDDNQTLHQAGCNLLWNVTDGTAYGLEYQFGSRELGSGAYGDDHRVMFVLQATAANKQRGAERTAASYGTTSYRPLSLRRL